MDNTDCSYRYRSRGKKKKKKTRENVGTVLNGTEMLVAKDME